MRLAGGRIGEGADLGQEVHLQEVRVQLNDLPVRRRQRLDIDRVRLRRLKVKRYRDLLCYISRNALTQLVFSFRSHTFMPSLNPSNLPKVASTSTTDTS